MPLKAFLTVLEKVVPWKRLVVRLEAHYPKRGSAGEPTSQGDAFRNRRVRDDVFLPDGVSGDKWTPTNRGGK